MNPPYIEINQIDSQEWQAIIAWHINIPPHKDWLSSRWGFNAAALLDEALDRLRLFINSFHTIDIYTRSEPQYAKTLALRCFNIPGDGLQLGLVGKIFSPTSNEAIASAKMFCREIESTFPHDFSIFRVTTKSLFLQITAESMFDSNNESTKILQIKRANVITSSPNGPNFLTGFWQANHRSSEQIWRALASASDPVLLNITLRTTLIFENELRLLWDTKRQLENNEGEQTEFDSLYYSLPWCKNYINRRLSSWIKFYYLQVHIITKGKFDESLACNIGSAMTYDGNQLMPGFLIETPESIQESQMWLSNLRQLEIIPSAIRLHDIADLEETYSAFRFPYLSETGLPNVNFLTRLMD